MRFLPGLICLLPLLSPLAHAELIDDVNDRGELRIALEANTPLSISRKTTSLRASKLNSVNCSPTNWMFGLTSSSPTAAIC